MFEGTDHLGIAVEELDGALSTYRETFDMALLHREVIPDQGVEVALLAAGDSHLELLAPLGPDTPVGRFLAQRGPGVHHIAYRVVDIEATLAQLRARDVELIDSAPRIGIRASRVAFVHPHATGGVLTELVEAPGR